MKLVLLKPIPVNPRGSVPPARIGRVPLRRDDCGEFVQNGDSSADAAERLGQMAFGQSAAPSQAAKGADCFEQCCEGDLHPLIFRRIPA